MKKGDLIQHSKRVLSTALSLCLLSGLIPTAHAATSEIWPGYPGTDQLTATDTISNPFQFFNAANDPNGDGYVSTTNEWTARKTEIKDLVQHYWLGYRWPTQASDVYGERKVLDDPNTISVGGYFGYGSTTFNLGTVFNDLMETLKTKAVEIRTIIPAQGYGSATLGDVVDTIGPATNPNDAAELQTLALSAWNKGYYVPYTSFGSQAYAVLKNSTGEITAAPSTTKPVMHNVVTVKNPDTNVEASFNITIDTPTDEQIANVWGNSNAKVPVVIQIGSVLSSDHATKLKEQGYGVISFNPTDIYPDDSEASDGINRNGVYTKLYPYNKDQYEYASGGLMAWGWGVSQIISALEQVTPEDNSGLTWGEKLKIDPTKTVVTGHSRNGKAAMFAAAFDDRISICVPSEAGGSGIQSYRYKVEGKIFDFNAYTKADRVYGKTEIPTVSYGQGSSWFPEQAANFLNKDNQLPFDADDIISLVAPRPFFTTTGIDTHWLGNEGSVASIQAASEVYKYIGQNETEKNNIAVRARESNHVFYNRDLPFLLAIMNREFNPSNGSSLHVKDLFPDGDGSLNSMSFPAKDYNSISEFNSYPFDINSSYLPWSSANKYILWTKQESFLIGTPVTFTAHSDSPKVELYLPDGTTKIDAVSHTGDAFVFKLTPEQAVRGRYELRTVGSSKENRSVFFSAVSLSDSLRHATSKGDEGEQNRVIGFASRLANTKTDAPQVYIDGQKVTMNFTPNRVPAEETTLLEYGVQFHDKLFSRIAEGWNSSKTFDIKNLKFIAIPDFTFEISFDDVYASAANSGKDGAAKFTKPISWNVEKFNNGPAAVWPVIPDTLAEKQTLNAGGTVTRPTAPAVKATNFNTVISDVTSKWEGNVLKLQIGFNEAMRTGQFGFGLNVAKEWATTWNEAGTQVTLSMPKSNLTSSITDGKLIIFRLMDADGNLIGAPVEKSFTIPAVNTDPGTPTNPGTTTENTDSGTSTPSSPASQSFYDSQTGITLDYSAVFLPAGTTFTSQIAASNSNISNSLNAMLAKNPQLGKFSNIVIHELKLLDVDKKEISSFNGKIKVKLPIPTGMGDNPSVFWYDTTSNQLVDMQATRSGNYLVFSTNHFSYYVVADSVKTLAAGAPAMDHAVAVTDFKMN